MWYHSQAYPEHEGRGCSLARLRCTSGLRNCLRAGALTGVTDPLITAGYPRGFTLSLRTSFAYDRFRRYLVVAARSGEGPLTGPLQTHSSRIANWYFVEFTAYARASLTMGFAQLNPSYRETTERIQDAARPARIASLIKAASGRCRCEFAASTSPLDIIS